MVSRLKYTEFFIRLLPRGGFFISGNYKYTKIVVLLNQSIIEYD